MHDERRAPQDGLDRAAQLAVVEVVVRGDDDDVRAGREVRAVEDPQAGVEDVAVDGGRADDVRGPVIGLGEDELQRAADRHDLLARRLEAEAPQLADVLVVAVAAVVRDEGDALVRLAQRRDRLLRAGRRLVADPDAAVEVEEDVVVA